MQTIDGFAGRQLGAGDPGYDEARALFNGMIDARPALIAQCEGADDIARAVAHALHHDVPLAVRAGGHSVAGMSTNDAGVVVDVRPLTEIERRRRRAHDPLRCRCHVGGLRPRDTGARSGDHGRARLHDRRRRADPRRRLRLARAAPRARLRQPARGRSRHGHRRPGARGRRRAPGAAVGAARRRRNFGVATAFEFRLHPVGPTVHGGLAMYDPADGPSVAAHDARLLPGRAAPRPRSCSCHGRAAGAVRARASRQGRIVAAIAGMWIGPPDDGAARAAPAGRRRSARRQPLRRAAVHGVAVDDRRPARHAELVDGRLPR